MVGRWRSGGRQAPSQRGVTYYGKSAMSLLYEEVAVEDTTLYVS